MRDRINVRARDVGIVGLVPLFIKKATMRDQPPRLSVFQSAEAAGKQRPSTLIDAAKNGGALATKKVRLCHPDCQTQAGRPNAPERQFLCTAHANNYHSFYRKLRSLSK